MGAHGHNLRLFQRPLRLHGVHTNAAQSNTRIGKRKLCNLPVEFCILYGHCNSVAARKNITIQNHRIDFHVFRYCPFLLRKKYERKENKIDGHGDCRHADRRSVPGSIKIINRRNQFNSCLCIHDEYFFLDLRYCIQYTLWKIQISQADIRACTDKWNIDGVGNNIVYHRPQRW